MYKLSSTRTQVSGVQGIAIAPWEHKDLKNTGSLATRQQSSLGEGRYANNKNIKENDSCQNDSFKAEEILRRKGSSWDQA